MPHLYSSRTVVCNRGSLKVLVVSCFMFLVVSFVSAAEGLCFPTAGRTRLRGAHGIDECQLNERLGAMPAFFLIQTSACQRDEHGGDIIPLFSVWICLNSTGKS